MAAIAPPPDDEQFGRTGTRADADAAAVAMARLPDHHGHPPRPRGAGDRAHLAKSEDDPAYMEMAKQSQPRAGPAQGRISSPGCRTAPPKEQDALRAIVPGPVLAIIGGIFGPSLPQGGRARLAADLQGAARYSAAEGRSDRRAAAD